MVTPQPNKLTKRLRQIADEIDLRRKAGKSVPKIPVNPAPEIEWGDEEPTKGGAILPPAYVPSKVPKPVQGLVAVLNTLPMGARAFVVFGVLGLLAFMVSKGAGWL